MSTALATSGFGSGRWAVRFGPGGQSGSGQWAVRSVCPGVALAIIVVGTSSHAVYLLTEWLATVLCLYGRCDAMWSGQYVTSMYSLNSGKAWLEKAVLQKAKLGGMIMNE